MNLSGIFPFGDGRHGLSWRTGINAVLRSWCPAAPLGRPRRRSWPFAFALWLVAGLFTVASGRSIQAGVKGAAGCHGKERMVLIPAGTFILGSDAEERLLGYALSEEARRYRWFEVEPPREMIWLPDYLIDRCLVTNRDYQAFIKATGHRSPFISRGDYVRQGFLVHDYEKEVTRFLWRGDASPKGVDDHPVVLVSVADAESYCRWRGRQVGRDLRLPTEEEWEKAARGDDGRYFPWGNEWDPAKVNSAARGPSFTTPVGAYQGGRSPYGLYDMAGNVFQWTSSKLTDGRQILKGCSWDDEGGLCRAAFRHGRPPSSRHILIGFRCAGDAP